MNDVPKIALNDGNTIPQLGIGVFKVPQEQTIDVVLKALEVGYRHIDTAEMYGNEQQVGDAVKQSGIGRSEIFITSKLNNGYHEPDDARRAFEESLNKLSVDYIDLFLIHWPLPHLYNGDFVSTWQTLEEFKRDGCAKSIGVSNFQVPHLERLAKETETIPAVNQIELQPYFQNREVAAYNAAHGIATEAWSPIARGDVLEDTTITTIANEIDKSPAQVVLRWHIQKGYIIFPKSVTPARIEENFKLFDFELSDEQIKHIDDLHKGEDGRRGPNPDQNN
jgi:2,5-diketo-D-gluconate reductase A